MKTIRISLRKMLSHSNSDLSEVLNHRLMKMLLSMKIISSIIQVKREFLLPQRFPQLAISMTLLKINWFHLHLRVIQFYFFSLFGLEDSGQSESNSSAVDKMLLSYSPDFRQKGTPPIQEEQKNSQSKQKYLYLLLQFLLDLNFIRKPILQN